MGKVIAFFSGEKGGTGKTTLSVLSLIFLSEEKHRVLLVDLSIDMNYMGTLLKSLPKDCLVCHSECTKFGLFDYLLGNCKFIDTLNIIKGTNAVIIPAGDVSLDKMQDIDYRKIGQMLDTLRKKNIIVLLDFPTLRLYEPIAQLLQYCDNIIFVFEPIREHIVYVKRLSLTLKKLFGINRDDMKIVFNKVLSSALSVLTEETLNNILEHVKSWYKVSYVYVKYKIPASLPEVLLKRYIAYLKDPSKNGYLIKQVEELMLSQGRREFLKFLLS